MCYISETTKVINFKPLPLDLACPKPKCSQFQAFQIISVQLKQKFSFCTSPNFTLLTFSWFWVGKMHRNCLKAPCSSFGVCQIQWEWFQVSTISSFWEIRVLGVKKRWVGKMHRNCLKVTLSGFGAYRIQWEWFQVSTISSFWEIRVLGVKKGEK